MPVNGCFRFTYFLCDLWHCYIGVTFKASVICLSTAFILSFVCDNFYETENKCWLISLICCFAYQWNVYRGSYGSWEKWKTYASAWIIKIDNRRNMTAIISGHGKPPSRRIIEEPQLKSEIYTKLIPITGNTWIIRHSSIICAAGWNDRFGDLWKDGCKGIRRTWLYTASD